MASSDIRQLVYLAGSAPQMHADDARGAGGDHLLYLLRINVMSTRIYVTKDGSDLLPLEGMGRSDKGERGNDNFASKPSCPYSDLQSHGSVACSDAVTDPHNFSD